MNRPAQAINEIVRGVKQITPEIAHDLSEALGTSPDFWANLESKYRLHSSNPSKPSS
jgi:plasmid maintenance system antidote protein VapI